MISFATVYSQRLSHCEGRWRLFETRASLHRPHRGVHGCRTGRLHYRGNITAMALAHSKVTAQGQVSVPAKVRQRLGVGPGSMLEWDEDGDRVVVRKAGRYSSEDIHRALFPKTPNRRAVQEMKDGIRRHIQKRHASR